MRFPKWSLFTQHYSKLIFDWLDIRQSIASAISTLLKYQGPGAISDSVSKMSGLPVVTSDVEPARINPKDLLSKHHIRDENYAVRSFRVIRFDALVHPRMLLSDNRRSSSTLLHLQYDWQMTIVAVLESHQFLVFCVNVVL